MKFPRRAGDAAVTFSSIGICPLRRGAFAAVLVAWVLAGCAGASAYREGRTLLGEGKLEQGLGKLEEAVKLEPRNAEYRIALSSQRASAVGRLVSAGELGLREGRLTEAEKAFGQALALDPHNAMARQGLDAIVADRRHRLLLGEADSALKRGGPADLAEAEGKLRTVQAENPGRKDAQVLKGRLDELRAKQRRPGAQLAATFRKPITLEFRDAPLKSVFDVVAKVSGMNFYFDKDLRPDIKVTILAKNTSIEDALRLVLVTNQLEQKVLNDNSILIYPSTPQKLKEYQTLAVRTFYLANADVKAVSNSIKTIVKTKDMVIDERLGILIMRDTPEAIRIAERIVALQDLSDPEVMLEVEVMELKRSRLLELGVQWPSQMTLSPLVDSANPLTLERLRNLTKATTQVGVGNMLINARKEDQDGNILANPRIRVRNKEKAKVLIGDRVPIITTTTSPATNANYVSEAVNYIDVGLKLEVEPMIYLDDEVAIKVNLEVSSLVREVVSKSGTLAYQIGTRGANTVLRLKDGETQILAGLINDEDRSTANKVPGLGELPMLGRLFGSQKDDTQRSEILLSITPRVVRSNRRPDLLDAEFDSGTESSIGAESLRLSTLEPAEAAASAPARATSGAPVATPPATPVSTAGGMGPAPSLAWQAPAQVKAGEQFTAVLQVNSPGALRGLPMLIGFDPQVLQVAQVQEGGFFKQGGGAVQFSHRVDTAQGKIFVAAVRQNPSGTDAGVNGVGAAVMVTFKALKASTGNGARVQLLSASPEPVPAVPVALPVEKWVRVTP